MTHMNASEEENQEFEEEEIDATALTRKQKEALILDMQAEEMMKKREQVKEVLPSPEKKKKRRKKKKLTEMSGAEIAPGFGWVVIKMASAMTFSMVFILIGPILIFFSLVQLIRTQWSIDWSALYFSGYIIFIFVGIGMVVAAYYLFRYIIRD
ncbi:MAG: hypothetical protein KGD59_09655 [Candidatus Heimdallarchaeota archaeon]|nr:hypothetical protein [Candidatus Heimdallarchaeota archaeon]MBY8994800.1 hypothetical protein [Candidatus Heimdallarchaeota archaeon]